MCQFLQAARPRHVPVPGAPPRRARVTSRSTTRRSRRLLDGIDVEAAPRRARHRACTDDERAQGAIEMTCTCTRAVDSAIERVRYENVVLVEAARTHERRGSRRRSRASRRADVDDGTLAKTSEPDAREGHRRARQASARVRAAQGAARAASPPNLPSRRPSASTCTQLELEFAETKAKLDALATQLERRAPTGRRAGVRRAAMPPEHGRRPQPASKPKGRRNLRDEDMPEERIEILDPALEGTAERIGFEESYQRSATGAAVRSASSWRARSTRSLTTATTRGVDEPVVRARDGAECRRRSSSAGCSRRRSSRTSSRRSIASGSRSTGSREMLRAQGVRLDDSTMCRYAEHVGATLGCIVDAMREGGEGDGLLPLDRRDRRCDSAGADSRPASGRPAARVTSSSCSPTRTTSSSSTSRSTRATPSARCSRASRATSRPTPTAIYDALFRGEAA